MRTERGRNDHFVPMTFFRPGGSWASLTPLPCAASAWGAGDSVRGMASSAVLARQVLATLAAEGLQDVSPARWTADLSRPTRMEPLKTRGRVLRAGRRLVLVDAELLQRDDQVMARARAVFVRPGAAAKGEVWEEQHALPVPPADLLPRPDDSRVYWTQGDGWSAQRASHSNVHRKALWEFPFELVSGEKLDPFVFATGAADLASVVTQTGDAGQQHINVDMSLLMVRMPECLERGIGVTAIHRMSEEGQAVGTAILHDVTGPIGTASVAALQNEAGR